MRIRLLDTINPFVKAVTVIVCCLMLAATSSWKVNLAVFGISLLAMLFLSGCRVSTLVKTLLPIFFLAAAVFVSGLINGRDAEAVSGSIYQVTSMDSALLLSTRILGYVSLGLLFGFTTDSKLFIISLMHQAKLSPKFAYGILAAFNLIPTLRREWDEVHLAYRARQKKTGLIPIGPLFNTLVNGIRWSENVAMAMESKGFDGDGQRTYSITTKVCAKDLIFAGICLAMMIAIVIVLR